MDRSKLSAPCCQQKQRQRAATLSGLLWLAAACTLAPALAGGGGGKGTLPCLSMPLPLPHPSYRQVVASDGLWDVMDSQEVVKLARRDLQRGLDPQVGGGGGRGAA